MLVSCKSLFIFIYLSIILVQLAGVFARSRITTVVSVSCYLYVTSSNTEWVIKHNWVSGWEPDGCTESTLTAQTQYLVWWVCVSLICHKECAHQFESPHTYIVWVGTGICLCVQLRVFAHVFLEDLPCPSSASPFQDKQLQFRRRPFFHHSLHFFFIPRRPCFLTARERHYPAPLAVLRSQHASC